MAPVTARHPHDARREPVENGATQAGSRSRSRRAGRTGARSRGEEHGRTSRMTFDMPAAAMAERLGRTDSSGRLPHVQRLFPEFDADQREFFISGMLPGELDFGDGDGT